MNYDPQKLISKVLTENPSLNSSSNFSSLLWLFSSLLIFLSALSMLYFDLMHYGVISFFLIGIFQYHLLVALHESCHYGLFTKKLINKLFARVIAGILSFDSKTGRETHMHHHKMYGRHELDPDYPDYIVSPSHTNFPKYLIFIFARPFLKQLGISKSKQSSKKLNETGRNLSFSYVFTLISTQTVLFLIFIAITNVWWAYFLFWIGPLPIVPSILTRCRTIGEHGGLSEDIPNLKQQFIYAKTTTDDRKGIHYIRYMIELFFLAPYNFNFHHEHHMRPGIPYSSLPFIHGVLKESGHYDRYPENLSRSYFVSIATFLRNEFSKNKKELDQFANRINS